MELLRLYSNLQTGRTGLLNVRLAALLAHRPPASAVPRLTTTRLDAVAVADLIRGYRSGAKISDLAMRFGIHRTTVTGLLRRHGVELRQVGLLTRQVTDACRLYQEGWSVARLGEKFGVDGTTVWRYLLLARETMRSPHEKRSHG